MTRETWNEVKDIGLLVLLIVMLGIGLYQTVTFVPE